MHIIIFIAILALLILVHELGHFIAAKKNGIFVEEFGFGFPPRLFGHKFGETIYSINLIPLGGFVKMYGEEYHELNSQTNAKDSDRAFSGKHPFRKAIVVVAGVIGNFLLGWIIISYLFTKGVPTLTNQIIIDSVVPGTPAAQAGLKPNDVIVGLNDKAAKEGEYYKVKTSDYLWKIAQEKYRDGFYAYKIAKVNNISNPSIIYPDQVIFLPSVIPQQIEVGTINKIVFKTAEEFVDLTEKHAGQSVFLIVERNNRKIEIAVTPRKKPPAGQGPLGITVTPFVEKKYPWYRAPFFGLVEAFNTTKKISVEMVKIIISIATFQKTKLDVAGPIGIAQYTGQAIKFGYKAVFELIALLSLNLAVVNILPFPALDGGRLVFVVYEWITRKKFNQNWERNLNFIGFALLIVLAIAISVHDIIRLFK
ncbi:RIP metalloprotease RseP [Candidatus Roizmanbacteria bacterium]|jgi:regulator of sigma E protease|nr:RIP metalloprotease RseP [Candidatus Roizmanbacteria bacterium]